MRTKFPANEKILADSVQINIKLVFIKQTAPESLHTNTFSINSLLFTHNIAYAVLVIQENGLLSDVRGATNTVVWQQGPKPLGNTKIAS